MPLYGGEEIHQVERLGEVTSVAPVANHGKKAHSNKLHKGVDATKAVDMVTFDKIAQYFALEKDAETTPHVDSKNFQRRRH